MTRFTWELKKDADRTNDELATWICFRRLINVFAAAAIAAGDGGGANEAR
jgi:hypothetical protein